MLGLSVTFAVTIIGIAKVVDGVGLGSDPLRAIAVVVLLGFGGALVFPSLAARLEAPLAGLSRFGPRSRGDGFLSGLVVGAALGFVYTPCAGPILAAVDLGRRRHRALGGRRAGLHGRLGRGPVRAGPRRAQAVFDRVRRAGGGPTLQRVLGVIMIVTALAIVSNEDVTFDQWVAQHIADVNITHGLETSSTVTSACTRSPAIRRSSSPRRRRPARSPLIPRRRERTRISDRRRRSPTPSSGSTRPATGR